MLIISESKGIMLSALAFTYISPVVLFIPGSSGRNRSVCSITLLYGNSIEVWASPICAMTGANLRYSAMEEMESGNSSFTLATEFNNALMPMLPNRFG